MPKLISLENLTQGRGEGSVVLVRVATGVIWSRGVGLERSTLGVIVRGGGRGVVRGRFASSSSVDAAVVSVRLAGLQSEVVLVAVAVAGVGIVLVL